jgi:HKD family nuclease
MAMLRVLHGHPLRALDDRFELNMKEADEVWILSAFVDRASVSILSDTRRPRCKIRFLTGTYANATRLRTFRALARLAHAREITARIWDCGAHRQLHGKLYLWRCGRRGVAWIGSANFTESGLREQGEIVAEVRGAWNTPEIHALRAAFEKEWSLRSNLPLDATFLRRYREAARVPPEVAGTSRRRPGSRRLNRTQVARVFWVPADVSDRMVERVDAVLGPSRPGWRGWWFLWGRQGVSVQPGDKLVVATSATTYALAEARQPVRIGSGRVAVPYEPLRGCVDLRMTKTLRSRWADEGIFEAGKVWHRSRVLDRDQWDGIVRIARKRLRK